ncbi:molybdopterin molybdotransferase MoeA [Alicyclobacillus acidiphilus]|uniref:molybdopterin molybdotransferase MoeA n=1 Tax=Alicyclobacillus acidiphilus TaxID=182455 RepID=UPI00083573DA|nr:molybdopterin molybdotransferase MoeA [Alicyclobacillus acidiphilus]
MDIVTFDEATAIVAQLAVAPEREVIDIWEADATSHRVAAADIHSQLELPTFDRAMMDGYAIHRDDLAATGALRVIGSTAAGEARAMSIRSGETVRVRTGAPVPPGTAAVVRQEWVEPVGSPSTAAGTPESIRMLQRVRDGESVQRAGEDARRGDVIVRRGDVIDGQSRAVMRASGVRLIEVFRPCRIAIVCTGSELIARHTENLPIGKVFGASEAFLRSGVEAAGATVVSVEYVPDDYAAIRDAVARWIGSVDYVLLTGGASVGDTDFAHRSIAALDGIEPIALSRIWIRPGAPFVARRVHRTTVFAMSGNPAACFVQFHALVLPAILRSLGHAHVEPFPFAARLREDVRLKPVKHVRLLRSVAAFDGVELAVQPQAKQSSGSVTGLVHANALIRLDEAVYNRGTVVPLLFTRPFAFPFSRA